MNFSPFPGATITPKNLFRLTEGLQSLLRSYFWAKILLSLVLGLLVGFLMGPTLNWVPQEFREVTASWLGFPGQLFLAIIQMVVMPLIFASVVLGIAASESLQQLKSVGLRLTLYYVTTSLVAVSMGLAVGLIIKPGTHLSPSALESLGSQEKTTVALPSPSSQKPPGFDLKEVPAKITALVPQNPLGSMASGQMLHIVFFAIFVGVALLALTSEQARPLLDLLASLQQVSMVVVRWAMYLAPIAVFGLMAKMMMQVGLDVLVGLGYYVITVLLGLGLVILFYLLINRLFAKQSARLFLKNIREVQLLAFSTSSSAAVMPLTVKTAIEKLKVSPSLAHFVIPLGTTVNMDGTALYQGVATVFMAQLFQVDLSVGQLAFVVITATVASIGAPGTPGVGIAVLAMILSSVGIPPQGVLLILSVERILDMARTVVNVTGDLTAATVMNRVIKDSPHNFQKQ